MCPPHPPPQLDSQLPPSVPQPSPSVEPALDAEPSVNAENDVNMNDDTEEDDQIMTPADKHHYNTRSAKRQHSPELSRRAKQRRADFVYY
jgi:hypothetical protein